MGRPMALPNLVRLYRRRVCACVERIPAPELARRTDESVRVLIDVYREWQPFV
jgi:hypothetical protein